MPMCSKDVCLTKTCPAHPKATCKMNFCGGCFHDFFLDGKKVDCDNFVKQECKLVVFVYIKYIVKRLS